MKSNLHAIPSHFLICPKCGATPSTGLDLNTNQCNSCGTQFFDLSGIPCWFANGIEQKSIWESTLGIMLAQWQENLEGQKKDYYRKDLIPPVRERMQHLIEANENIYATVGNELTTSGLNLNTDRDNAMDPTIFADYFDLLLRDWGWQENKDDPPENKDALARVISLIENNDINKASSILVLGSGAGKLSWDIHQYFNSDATIAIDYNPILLLFSKRIIVDQSSFKLADLRAYPQKDKSLAEIVELAPPKAEKELRETWYALGADVWDIPLAPESFDLIVTPWFIDVNGRDVRELIALVDTLLKPGGHWINTGPLLYMDRVPYSVRYNFDEIKSFIELSGLVFSEERIDQVCYLKSPLDKRMRQEEVWTFIAKKPQAKKSKAIKGFPPPWFVMTYLPVENIQLRDTQSHPVIDKIKENIDGKRSINDIAKIIETDFDPGCDCVDLVISIFDEFLLP